jgi:hypothetical protein
MPSAGGCAAGSAGGRGLSAPLPHESLRDSLALFTMRFTPLLQVRPCEVASGKQTRDVDSRNGPATLRKAASYRELTLA